MVVAIPGLAAADAVIRGTMDAHRMVIGDMLGGGNDDGKVASHESE